MKKSNLILLFSLMLIVFSCDNKTKIQSNLETDKSSPSSVLSSADANKDLLLSNVNLFDKNQILYDIRVKEDGVDYYYGVFDEVDMTKINLKSIETYLFKVASFEPVTSNVLKQDIDLAQTHSCISNHISLGNKKRNDTFEKKYKKANKQRPESDLNVERFNLPTDRYVEDKGRPMGRLLKGLLAWYPFNGNANDESGNGKDGIIYGATPSTDRFGKQNAAYNFNGVDNYISISSSSNLLKLIGDKTISVWAKTSNPKHTFLFGDKIMNYVLRIDKTPIDFEDSWSSFVVTYSQDKGRIKLYANGKLYKSANVGNIDLNSSSSMPMIIGCENISSESYFRGNIDDVGIWKRVLTEDEIKSLYNLR